MQPGTQVGAYRVVHQIGAGGMGTVWLAEHQMLGRRAAIKVLHPMFSAQPEIVTRFFNEARSAAAISDPGIVQIFDFGHHSDGSAYIAMEMLEGEPLDQRLRRLGRLPVVEAVRILRQTASSLGVAHGRGIVHRDLKPENIFLIADQEMSGGERAKILDFGIAKLTSDPRIKTQTSAVMGTPAYMSPEQCRGAGLVDQRADVYALGCVLFTLVTGTLPFDAEGAGEIIAMHLREPPPAPSSRMPGLPPALDALVLRCLAKDPAQRYPSARELAAELGHLLAQLTSSGPMSGAMPPMSGAMPPMSGSYGFAPPPMHAASTTLSHGAGSHATSAPPSRRGGGRLAAALAVAGVAAAAVVAVVVLRSGGSPAVEGSGGGTQLATVTPPPDARPEAGADAGPTVVDASSSTVASDAGLAPPVDADAGMSAEHQRNVKIRAAWLTQMEQQKAREDKLREELRVAKAENERRGGVLGSAKGDSRKTGTGGISGGTGVGGSGAGGDLGKGRLGATTNETNAALPEKLNSAQVAPYMRRLTQRVLRCDPSLKGKKMFIHVAHSPEGKASLLRPGTELPSEKASDCVIQKLAEETLPRTKNFGAFRVNLVF